MSVCLVYDDRASVSDDARALLGLERFSAVLHKKRRVLDHVRELAAAAGVEEFVHVLRDADVEHLAERAARGGGAQRFLYFPSCVVPGRGVDAGALLRKLLLARRDIVLSVGGGAGGGGAVVLWVGREGLARVVEPLLRGDAGRVKRLAEQFCAHVRGAGELRDIASYDAFVEFVSGTFDTRHFNAVTHDGLSVIKRSHDVEKMRREFTFLSMVDGPMQAFFLRPYGFEEGTEPAAWASYRCERLNVPDMAMQWVHGAISGREFGVFLSRVERYLRERPVLRVDPAAVRGAWREMYEGKVRARCEQARAMKEFAGVERLLAGAGRGAGQGAGASLDHLVRRWSALSQRVSGAGGNELVFTHGDPCFSNMLYDRRTQQLKLIDPRGAMKQDEMYSDACYDVAKISHSVLGGYDFINHGLFDVQLDDQLRASLVLHAPDLRALQAEFVRRMDALGFSYLRVRWCEASLFLSMLPLHMDVPRKVAAFVLRAGAIVDELESLA